jgi:tRNA threonylcarbamoyladenosine biosynthesis protein TsaB
MPTLRQLSAHFPALVIDSASAQIQVGELARDGTARWAQSAEESGVGIFTCIEKLGINPGTVGAFIFCDGPGSVLGVRTAAMALRTWCVLKPRPMFAYCSLALVAHAAGRGEIGVIADARRDSWHHFQIGRGLRRVPHPELTGELVTPEGFRNWTPLPPDVRRVPYALAELFPRVMDVDLFLATEAPDAFLHEEPSYVTWTPHIHQAPAR